MGTYLFRSAYGAAFVRARSVGACRRGNPRAFLARPYGEKRRHSAHVRPRPHNRCGMPQASPPAPCGQLSQSWARDGIFQPPAALKGRVRGLSPAMQGGRLTLASACDAGRQAYPSPAPAMHLPEYAPLRSRICTFPKPNMHLSECEYAER